MQKKKISGRGFKKEVLKLLEAKDFENICRLPPRQVVNPLFTFFHSRNETIRWRAVSVMGQVVSNLAEQDMESARVIMRRLLWNLNDESGGIGWGSPEAMGEIMSRHSGLADEYASLLVSFIRKDANYIEFEILQRGVLWGIGRLAHVRPQYLQSVPPLLLPFMKSKDANLRGLSAWTAGALASELTKDLLTRLADDKKKINIFLEGRVVEIMVGRLARDAIARLNGSPLKKNDV
jgi:hypothetical protein